MVACILRNYQQETALRQSYMWTANLTRTASFSNHTYLRYQINLTTIRSWSVSTRIILRYKAIIILRGLAPLSSFSYDVITLLTPVRASANQTNTSLIGWEGNSFSWSTTRNGSVLLILKKIRWRRKREVSGCQSALRFVRKMSIKLKLLTFTCKTVIAFSSAKSPRSKLGYLAASFS